MAGLPPKVMEATVSRTQRTFPCLVDDPEFVRRRPPARSMSRALSFTACRSSALNHEVDFFPNELLRGIAGVRGRVVVDKAESPVLDDIDAGDGLSVRVRNRCSLSSAVSATRLGPRLPSAIIAAALKLIWGVFDRGTTSVLLAP